MTNLTRLPVEDGFQTTLAQSWNGGTGTVYLNDTPAAVLGSNTTCIVVDPGKSYMQVAEINAINTSLDTVTVSSISIKSATGVTYSQVTHSAGAVVIISDNYQFWEDIQTAVNSKADIASPTFTGTSTFTGPVAITGTTSYLGFPALTTAQRLALTPANGYVVYDSTIGENYQYIAGAWNPFAAGSTQPNASPTVAGKGEVATTAQSKAGTDTGETGALMWVLPSDIAANIQSNTFLYAADAGVNDTYVIALTPALTAYTTGQEITFKANTANTGACTLNVNGLGAKAIKTTAGADPANSLIAANEIVTVIYDGTNMVLNKNNPVAFTRQGVVFSYDTTTASGTQVVNHTLGVAPQLITFDTLRGGDYSFGTYDGTNNVCIYGDNAATSPNSSSAYCIRSDDSGSDYATGVISAVSTTTFTITWTKNGSATGTLYGKATLQNVS